MMADTTSLTRTFLESHADVAARVIEELPISAASALLSQTPARVCAPALQQMSPTVAQRILAVLPEDQVQGLLQSLGMQSAVAILRHFDKPRRDQLIAGLPGVSALASRILLGFPEDSVGAWIDPQLLIMPPDTTVEEAVRRVRIDVAGRASEIMLVGEQQHLIGIVQLSDLLRAPGPTALTSLARAHTMTIPAMMPLAAAAALSVWERALTAPVTDAGGRLIGALRRETVMDRLRISERTQYADDNSALTVILGAAYWTAISSLLKAALEALPSTEPVVTERP